MATENKSGEAYWAANLRLVAFCLTIWFVVSFLMGIILRPMLKGIHVGGLDLGMWMAQQGSIYVFLILIFFYAIRMNALDRKFDVHED